MQQDVEFGPERPVPRAHAGNGLADQRKGQSGEAAEELQAEAPCDFIYIAGARECRQALGEVQPGDCSIIPGYLPLLPPRTVVFFPPFLLDVLLLLVQELFCLLLLAGAFLATVFAAAFVLVLYCSYRRIPTVLATLPTLLLPVRLSR